MARTDVNISLTSAELARLATNLTMMLEYATASIELIEAKTGIPFRQLAAEDAKNGEAVSA